MNTTGEEAARAAPARAAVTVGAVETEYLRVGTGPPVVVLEPALAAAVARGTVPGRWHGYRLIVPLRTTIEAPCDAPFDAWLRGLIDGLGLTRPIVVASDRLLPEVRRFADENPGEIEATATG